MSLLSDWHEVHEVELKTLRAHLKDCNFPK